MEQILQRTFQEHKRQLQELADRLLTELSGDSQTNTLRGIQQNLADERFRLVVLGQFKRGKSTFINALLGQAVLPTDVIPVTAVITEVRHGTSPRAVVTFENGEEKQIELDHLPEFVSEENNPRNVRKVDKVDVFYPARILEQGLIIVDTPGVGSVHEHNTRLTQEYLPQADAAIFLFSSDPPLTEAEREFLKTLAPVIPHLIFVLNKKDYLDESSLQRVLEFNRQRLRELLGQDPEIAAVSALHALRAVEENNDLLWQRSGMAEVQTRLDRFLLREKGRFLIISNAERLRRVCNEKKHLLDLDRRAAQLSVQDLNQRLEAFARYVEKIRRDSQRLSFILEEVKHRLMAFFDRESLAFAQETLTELHSETAAFVETNRRLPRRKLVAEIERRVNALVIDRFEPFRLRLQRVIQEQYAEEIETVNREVQEIVDQVYQYSAELFEVPEVARVHTRAWQYKSRFFYKTWEESAQLELVTNALSYLLPGPLFLARTKKVALRKVADRLEEQRGRLRADTLYGLQDSNRHFLYEFSRFLDGLQDAISGLIRKHLELKERGSAELEKLEEQQRKVEATLSAALEEIDAIESFWESLEAAA